MQDYSEKNSGPFEEDGSGRPIFSNRHCFYFSKTGNLKVTREWLRFSPNLRRSYCHTCWLFADRTNPNFQWQWIAGSSRHYGFKIKRHESSSIHFSSISLFSLFSVVNGYNGSKLRMSTDPRLACYATELVWDVCRY